MKTVSILTFYTFKLSGTTTAALKALIHHTRNSVSHLPLSVFGFFEGFQHGKA